MCTNLFDDWPCVVTGLHQASDDSSAPLQGLRSRSQQLGGDLHRDLRHVGTHLQEAVNRLLDILENKEIKINCMFKKEHARTKPLLRLENIFR